MASIETFVVALACGLAAAGLGAGLYEVGVIDPVWPKRRDIVAPRHGGINRKLFWIPQHVAFEFLLVCSLVLVWNQPGVRFWLLLALASHAAMRIWSFVYFVPRALRFEAMEPDQVSEAEARQWTRWSRLRVLLDLATSLAMFVGLIALIRLS